MRSHPLQITQQQWCAMKAQEHDSFTLNQVSSVTTKTKYNVN